MDTLDTCFCPENTKTIDKTISIHGNSQKLVVFGIYMFSKMTVNYKTDFYQKPYINMLIRLDKSI